MGSQWAVRTRGMHASPSRKQKTQVSSLETQQMAQANDENMISGMVRIDYKAETATFYLGDYQTVDGKKQFVPNRKFFQEADTNFEPLRIKQLPLRYIDMSKVYPQRDDEDTREVPFYMPERKFDKGARAYIRVKRIEIERKAMESHMNLLSDDEDMLGA
jgi:hypothetical protein